MGTFHIHMKKIHPGVREAMTEAESTPSSKKSKTNCCNFYADGAGLHFFFFFFERTLQINQIV